jgi:hypothetical protein
MTNDAAPYRLPDNDSHPAVIAERVMRMPEHLHLVDNEIEIDWLMRTHEKIKGGRMILGSVHEPTCQGEFKILFQWMLENLLGRLPRFLVILDDAYWKQASAKEREILIFHELAHIQHMLDRYGAPRFDKDGMPVYGLAGHDVEEFTSVVARYGAYSDEIRAFVAATQGN